MFLNSLIELFAYLTVCSFKVYNSFVLVYSQSYVSTNTLDAKLFSASKETLSPTAAVPHLSRPGNHEPTSCSWDEPVLGISHKRNHTLCGLCAGFSH